MDGRVLSMSCPDASGAFFAVVAICRINNLRVINMPEWFKSTPRNQWGCWPDRLVTPSVFVAYEHCKIHEHFS